MKLSTWHHPTISYPPIKMNNSSITSWESPYIITMITIPTWPLQAGYRYRRTHVLVVFHVDAEMTLQNCKTGERCVLTGSCQQGYLGWIKRDGKCIHCLSTCSNWTSSKADRNRYGALGVSQRSSSFMFITSSQVRLWYEEPTNKLYVTALQAEHLPPRENGATRNPYIRMYLLPGERLKWP